MLCALYTEFNPRFSPILLIYRFAHWKIEETDFTCVLAVTITTVDGNTCFAVHAPYVLHEQSRSFRYSSRTQIYSELTIYNICNFGDIYIPTREFRVFYITMKILIILGTIHYSTCI
jgi:hypothetical protein